MAEAVLAAFRRSMAGTSLPVSSRLAVALSGGPDSMALAALVARALPQRSPPHVALVVDHGLRPESGAEARHVAAQATSRLGLKSLVLTVDWGGSPPAKAATQLAARHRRYDLLCEACRKLGCTALLTAHHADDQAETFVLRLLHGSGLHGLACMRSELDLTSAMPELKGRGATGAFWDPDNRDAAVSSLVLNNLGVHGERPTPVLPHPDITLLRPLLEVGKAQLEAYALSQGMAYVIDPSNASRVYQRNRVRALLREAPPSVVPALNRLRRACALVAEELEESAAATLRLAAVAGPEVWSRATASKAAFAVAGLDDKAGSNGTAWYNVCILASAERPAATIRLLLQRVTGGYPPASSAVDELASRLAGGRLRGAWTGGGCIVRPVPGTKGTLMSCQSQRPKPRSAG